MKKLLKNKRGMALETAIMFMLVAFTLGFLLTGVVMTSHLRVRLNAKTIENEIAIEQIGQNFVDGALTESGEVDGYTAVINDEKTVLTLTNKKGERVLKIEKNGSTIVQWKYSKD
jgi:hypothetical protein